MPSNRTAETTDGQTTAVVTWTEPTATDNSGRLTLASSHNSGDSFQPGVTEVEYIATDPFGNVNTAAFYITLIGNCRSCFGRM